METTIPGRSYVDLLWIELVPSKKNRPFTRGTCDYLEVPLVEGKLTEFANSFLGILRNSVEEGSIHHQFLLESLYSISLVPMGGTLFILNSISNNLTFYVI